MTPERYVTAQRAVCVYDFLALLPFALPFVNVQQLATMGQVNTLLGGDFWPVFDPIQLMMVQLLGVIGTGWTVWRWRNVSRELGVFEGGLRFFAASTLLWAFVQTGQPLLLVFAGIDVVSGAVLMTGLRLRKTTAATV
ncbi:MAG: hypothetical protein JJ868_18105 [Shimia sp.]|uniref:hypothetical protein n=1 Tax=Shimia sp. TaxID=1954381 RepID=UPI001B0697BC|nr:hypothetical protein [Shimia sp.]MBO6899286.1 hypothetical protein [Shimia sp.]